MTIKEKAKKEELAIETVAALAAAAGIDCSDVERELLHPTETIKLAGAVKAYRASAAEPVEALEPERVLFWSKIKKHVIQLGDNRIVFEKHRLELSSKEDGALIDKLRRLRVTEILEIKNEPFDVESDEYIEFDDMLSELMLTGANREKSKSGVQSVRAMFDKSELGDMKDGFSPARLKNRILQNKSFVRVINN